MNVADPRIAVAPNARPQAETAAPAEDLDTVLRDARQRFAEEFASQCERLAPPADQAGIAPLPEDAMKVLHRMAGLGGTVGFPRVSVKAAELEDAGRSTPMGRVELLHAVAALRLAFASDIADPGAGLPSSPPAVAAMTVLLVEDDRVQRAIISAQLRVLGHTPVTAVSGEEALEAARSARPDVILLDIGLPGIDGYAVCRMLKADPDLAGIPVAFMSAHGSVDDRLIGYSLGADDFIVKPVDPRELALRLRRLDRRGQPQDDREAVGWLTYEAFHRLAGESLGRYRCVLALIRTPADRAFDVASFMQAEIRRRDICGQYDRNHVIVLLPDVGAAAGLDRLAPIVESCRASGISGVYAGIAASEVAGGRTLEQLMEEADEALAIARYEDLAVARRPDTPREASAGAGTESLVLVADDDPEVVRIVDAHLGAEGYRRVLTFDGARTLEEIRVRHPDVVVLDLMMPRMTGFDVLASMRDLGEARPRVIVLSARNREEDVMRAFSLGADDFMLKPFNPQELLARIARLIKTADRTQRRRQ
ncbi:MAG: response regulator [Acidobacteriota bacterium]